MVLLWQLGYVYFFCGCVSIFSVLPFPPPFNLACYFSVCVSVGVAAAEEWGGGGPIHHPQRVSTWSLHHFSAKSLGLIR